MASLPTPRPSAPERDPEARWRLDFPIDWPDDHFVARRDFTKFLVLTSFAFAVGQIWIGVKSVLRRRAPAPDAERLMRLADLAVGEARPFEYAGVPSLLLRLSRSEIVAFGSLCTHLSCAVVPELDRGRLACPCHLGYFDARSGLPTAGPPRRPLDRVLIEVRGGWIWAVGRELRT